MKHQHFSLTRTFVLGTALCSTGLSASALASQLDTIRETRSITIAHREASIPFSYFDDQKRPIGYAMDLCAKLVTALEKELKVVEAQDHAEAFGMVASKKGQPVRFV